MLKLVFLNLGEAKLKTLRHWLLLAHAISNMYNVAKETKNCFKELVLFPVTWSLHTPSVQQNTCGFHYSLRVLLRVQLLILQSTIRHSSPEPLSPSAPLSFCDILDLPWCNKLVCSSTPRFRSCSQSALITHTTKRLKWWIERCISYWKLKGSFERYVPEIMLYAELPHVLFKKK